jgi:uncharacterized protein YoxC
MIWWIVGAVVLFALIVLAVVASGTLRRLAGLRTLSEQMKDTQHDVAALNAATAGLQANADLLKARLERTQGHVQLWKRARAGR